jgi:hypothetical protein
MGRGDPGGKHWAGLIRQTLSRFAVDTVPAHPGPSWRDDRTSKRKQQMVNAHRGSVTGLRRPPRTGEVMMPYSVLDRCARKRERKTPIEVRIEELGEIALGAPAE